MYRPANNADFTNPLPKIRQKTLAYGSKTLMCEFQLEKGATIPRHSHPHEQTGYLVSGRLLLTIGEETFTVSPGDSWCIAGNIEHQASAEEATVAVEVFSPVREDYLP